MGGVADDKVESALGGLRASDGGRDADLVVGMVGALPRQSDLLHEVGMATLPGKYVVVRAAAREGEHDAIDRAFNELSADERTRLAKLRKRHRAVAVFLHEVGHCLGATHEDSVRSLMNAAYSPKMEGFGNEALASMRVRLRLDEKKDIAVAPPEPALSASPTPGPPELSSEDQTRYARAAEALQAGNVPVAYETAKPLFGAYPNSRTVQDLRCQLATLRYLEKSELVGECAESVRLAAKSNP